MNEIRTLNIDEACQLLHTHKSTLYQKIASGEIPAARIGRSSQVRCGAEASTPDGSNGTMAG